MAGSGAKYKVIFEAELNTEKFSKQTQKLSQKKINIVGKDAQQNVNKVTQSIGDAIKKTIEWSVAVGLVYNSLNELKKGIQYIKDLDKSMTNIQVVTGKTDREIRTLAKDFNSLAKEMSATTLEVSEGSLEWFRQGKTAEEAQELVRASLIASKLANMSSAQATEYLTSILNGFKLEAEDAVTVLDKLVEVDNQSATSVAELAEALKRSSNSAQQAGVDFDTLTAYIATISSVTRKSAGSIGESFKTLFARLQNLKLGKLDEMGDDINDVELVLSKFTNTTLFDANRQFRDMDNVIAELAGEWGSLNSVEKSAIATAVAGVRQRENFLVLMENFGDVLKYQELQADATGRAWERYGIYQDSVEASVNRLTASWEGFWMETIQGDSIQWFYDLGAGIFEVLTKAGGLVPILKAILLLVIALKAEKIAMFLYNTAGGLDKVILGFSTFRTELIKNVAVAGSFKGGIKALVSTLASSIDPMVALTGALFAVVSAIQAVADKAREAKGDVDGLMMVLEGFYKGVARNAKDGTSALSEFDRSMEVVQARYDALNPLEKSFYNLQQIKHDALLEFNDALINSSLSFDEYRIALEGAIETAGYFIDEEGRVYEEIHTAGGIVRSYVNDIQVLNNERERSLELQRKQVIAQMEATAQMHKDTIGIGNYGRQLERVNEESKTFAEILGDLHGSMKDLIDISLNAQQGAFNIDDMITLVETYENWDELLKVEGDLITLNTDKLREMNIEKAKMAMWEQMASEGGMTPEQREIFDAYISQLERAVPMSKDYAETLQVISQAVTDMGGGMSGIAMEIGEISRQFQEGQITTQEYFDELEQRISQLDFGDFSSEESQLMFTGLVNDASNALVQISSMFDAGETDIMEYSDQLLGMTGIFDLLGKSAQNMGLEVDGVIGSLMGASSNLAQLQELNAEIFTVRHKQITDGLRVEDEAFRIHAQNLAELAIASGMQVTDMQGNVLTSSQQIVQYLTGSQANFNNFMGQSAGATSTAIAGILENAGILIQEFANGLDNFEAVISFTPSFDQMVPLPGILGDLGLGVPTFHISVGADVSGVNMGAVQGALANIGQALQDYAGSFSLDASMYDFELPTNQITGTGGAGSVSDYYDQITEAINNASDATNDMKDRVEELRKANILALQAQLDAYDDLIDKRKALLQTMLDERNYQRELGDAQKEIADIQAELVELAMDDSEEAQKKKDLLEEQLAEAMQNLEDLQFEHGIEQQMNALDAEQQAFHELIAQAISVVEGIQADNIDDFIAQLIEALGYIPTDTPITQAPNTDLGNIISQENAVNDLMGGDVAGFMAGNMSSSDIFSGRGYPPTETSISGGISIDKLIEINVAGDLDRQTIPQIEEIANKVIEKLNETMVTRGYKNQANTFSF